LFIINSIFILFKKSLYSVFHVKVNVDTIIKGVMSNIFFSNFIFYFYLG